MSPPSPFSLKPWSIACKLGIPPEAFSQYNLTPPPAASTIYATSLSSPFSLNSRPSSLILTQSFAHRWITWWQIPVLGMAYTNLDLALGNSGNTLLATNLLTYNAVADYMIDEYIDDQSQSSPTPSSRFAAPLLITCFSNSRPSLLPINLALVAFMM